MATETVECDLCEATPEFGAFAMPFVRMVGSFEPPPEERRLSCHDCKGAGFVHPIVQLANGAWERIPDAFPLRMRCATCLGTGWIEECPYCHGAGEFPEGECGGCQGLGWV